ncbi:hypothetical protein HLH17_06855 [Acinetobacter sp. ANC 5380]|uniref:Uncharacterized protein n=1 Tax=Acinetobacter terrae TaxID=2731247 RepID=A0A7Y2WAK8_9GAMM|nr:hypothetical protein [Acinetobacter terrae]NNH77392.1 hypothetical protein [Acinetobacter terrae]
MDQGVTLNIYNHEYAPPLKDSYIIAIENGVVVGKYPNKPNFRQQVTNDGYDILTVTKEIAERLWLNTISLKAEIITLDLSD